MICGTRHKKQFDKAGKKWRRKKLHSKLARHAAKAIHDQAAAGDVDAIVMLLHVIEPTIYPAPRLGDGEER